MQTATSKNPRTNSIDLFRYLSAILVVVIHSSFWHDWGNAGFFTGEILPRIAVPFFFAVSGYFFIQKLEAGQKVFRKQFCHLLSVYALWSFLYLLLDFKNQVLFGDVGVISFFKEFLISFCLFGSQGHFWFFPAIIISTAIVALAYRLKLSGALLPISIALYFLGCLGCSYFTLGVKIPVLGQFFEHHYFTAIRRIFLMGFPFFCAGLPVLRLEKVLKSKAVLFILWIASVILFLGEIFAVTYFELSATIVVTIGLYVLLIFTLLSLLSYPMPRWERTAAAARTIANLTYYSHPLFILLFTHGKLGECLPSSAVFLLTLLTTFLLGLALHLIIVGKNSKLLRLLVG